MQVSGQASPGSDPSTPASSIPVSVPFICRASPCDSCNKGALWLRKHQGTGRSHKHQPCSGKIPIGNTEARRCICSHVSVGYRTTQFHAGTIWMGRGHRGHPPGVAQSFLYGVQSLVYRKNADHIFWFSMYNTSLGKNAEPTRTRTRRSFPSPSTKPLPSRWEIGWRGSPALPAPGEGTGGPSKVSDRQESEGSNHRVFLPETGAFDKAAVSLEPVTRTRHLGTPLTLQNEISTRDGRWRECCLSLARAQPHPATRLSVTQAELWVLGDGTHACNVRFPCNTTFRFRRGKMSFRC